MFVYAMSDCTLGLGGEEKLEEKSIMEWNRLPPSLSPSSKTPATSMIVAPWEQKAQWKHRGTHRRRESSSEGERPMKKRANFQIQRKTFQLGKLLIIMKLFWHPPKQRLFG